MSEVIDKLAAGDAQPGDDIHHLVNFWATRVRATNSDLISSEQLQKVLSEFSAAMDEMDRDTRIRFINCVIDESDRIGVIGTQKPFWVEPADTAIKLMGNSLAKSIGA